MPVDRKAQTKTQNEKECNQVTLHVQGVKGAYYTQAQKSSKKAANQTRKPSIRLLKQDDLDLFLDSRSSSCRVQHKK